MTTNDMQCKPTTTIEDVCYKYEKGVEKVRFFKVDDSGKETPEIETYYIGYVYKSLHELKICEPEEYSKITQNMSWEQRAEDDSVYVRTETGRFIELTSGLDVAVDVRSLRDAQKPDSRTL